MPKAIFYLLEGDYKPEALNPEPCGSCKARVCITDSEQELLPLMEKNIQVLLFGTHWVILGLFWGNGK